ncbi:hypothetical protein EVG20_g5075 [Dentipellis fragilis]|uniref:Uncharacterized protein n=1 Tax=Dentipellis fragilis TaxID=205917 RepID=A0A4Y9YUB0_9AGAM|nr:hypothetical protein EVG20_g5075 [Dentipellis fragilis]
MVFGNTATIILCSLFLIVMATLTAGDPKALPSLIHRPTEGGMTYSSGPGQTSNHPGLDTTGGLTHFTLPLLVQATMSTRLTTSTEVTQPKELSIQEGTSAVTHKHTAEALHHSPNKTQAIDLGNQRPLGLSTNRYLSGSLGGPSTRSRKAETRGTKGQHKDKSRQPRSKILLAPIRATRFRRHVCPHTNSKKSCSRTKDAREYKWMCRLCQKKSERRHLALYESWERANEEMVFLFCGRDTSDLENEDSASP